MDGTVVADNAVAFSRCLMSSFCSYKEGLKEPTRVEGGELIYADCTLPDKKIVRLLRGKDTLNLFCQATPLEETEYKFARGLPMFEVAGKKDTEATLIALRHKPVWNLEPKFREEDKVSGVDLDMTFLKTPNHENEKQFYETLELKEYSKDRYLLDYVIEKLPQFKAPEQDKVRSYCWDYHCQINLELTKKLVDFKHDK